VPSIFLYSKISTDSGLIQHSHRFVAVVIQFLIPTGFSIGSRAQATLKESEGVHAKANFRFKLTLTGC